MSYGDWERVGGIEPPFSPWKGDVEPLNYTRWRLPHYFNKNKAWIQSSQSFKIKEMKKKFIICHYAEIGIKGKNRRFFERKLAENIKKGLKKEVPGSFISVKRISGRVIVELKNEKEKEKIAAVLKNIFGLSYFAFAFSSGQKIEVLAADALALLKKRKFETFKIATQRSKKDFPLTSQEINERVGAFIVKNLKKKVDLKNPQITCFVEIVDNFVFLYLKKIRGPGGLPVGVSGKAVVLLSGGIDSPVAAFYALKRGIRPIFLHFHS